MVKQMDLGDFDKVAKDIGERFNKQIKESVGDSLGDGFNDSDVKSKAEAKGREAGGAFAKSLRKEIDQALRNLPDVDLEVHADTSTALGQIAKLRAEMSDLGKKVGLGIDGKEALAQLAKIRAELEALHDETDDIEVKYDTRKAIDSIKGLQAEIDKLMSKDLDSGAFSRAFSNAFKDAASNLPEIEVNADTTPAEARLAALRTALEALGNVRIGVDLDTGEALAEAVGLRAELVALGENADIDLKFNVAQAVSSIDAFSRKVQQTVRDFENLGSGDFAKNLRAQLQSALDSLPTRIDLTANADNVNGALANIRLELEALAQKRINFDIDDKQFEAALARIRAQLFALGKTTTSVTLKADIDKVLASLGSGLERNLGTFSSKLRSSIQGALSNLPDIDLNVSDTKLNAALGLIRNELETFDFTITPDMNASEVLAKIELIKARLKQLESVSNDSLTMGLRAASQELANFETAVKESQNQVANAHKANLEAIRQSSRTAQEAISNALDKQAGEAATRIRKQFEGIAKSFPAIELHANSDEIDRTLAAVKAQFAAIGDKRIGLDLDEGEFLAQVAAAEAALKALPNEVRVRLATSGGNLFDDLRKVRSEVEGTKGAFTDFGSAVEAGLNTGETATKKFLAGFSFIRFAVVALIALFPLLATAILAIPAAIALIGLPIAAVIAGMAGIKLAFSQLAVPLASLQAQVSATFVAGLQPAIANINQILPTLTTGLSGVATALSTIATQVTAAFSSGQGLVQLQEIFTNLQSVLTGLAPVITTFTTNLAKLASEGLKGFQSLGPVFEQVGQVWTDTITRMSDTGVLTSAVSGLVEVFGSLLALIAPLTELGAALTALIGPSLAEIINGATASLDLFAGALTYVTSAMQQQAAAAAQYGNNISQVQKTLLALISGAATSTGPLQRVFATTIESIQDFVGVSTAAEGATQKLSGAAQSAAAGFQPLAAAQKAAADAAQAYNAAVQQYGAGSNEANAALGQLVQANQNLTTAQQEAAAAAGALNAALSQQISTFQSIVGSTLGYEAALQGVERAQQAAAKAIKAHGESSLEGRSATTSYAQAIDSAAQAAGKQAEAVAKANGALDPGAVGLRTYTASLLSLANGAQGPARAALLTLATSLSKTATDAASSDAALSGLATQVLTLPDGRTVTVIVDPSQVPGGLAKVQSTIEAAHPAITPTVNQAPAQQLQLYVNGLPLNPQITPLTTQVPPVLQGVSAQARALSLAPFITPNPAPVPGVLGGVVSTINAAQGTVGVNAADRGAAGVTSGILSGINGQLGTVGVTAADRGAAAAADGVVGTINGKTGTVNINGDPAGAQQAAQTAQSAVDGVKQTAPIPVTIDPAQALDGCNQVQQAIDNIKQGSPPTITVNDQASGVLDSIQGKINALQDKTITITTVQKTVTQNAAGAIYNFAKGGMMGMKPNMSSRRAAIVQPNTWRVIGDRPHGAEAFIPLNNSARSMMLLAMAANRMGQSIMPLASGGILERLATIGTGNERLSTQQIGQFAQTLNGSQVRSEGSVSTASGDSPLIGTLNLVTPPGASPKEYSDELTFALRRYRYGGVHNANVG